MEIEESMTASSSTNFFDNIKILWNWLSPLVNKS
jgi:hypothetical protein